MDRLGNVTKLEKDGKTYMLLSDGMWTHYLVDVKENKKSIQLNGINAKDRYFSTVMISLLYQMIMNLI